MTTLITLSQVSLTLGTKPLFSEISASIHSNNRIGLVGHNGSGKSTLLNLLSGSVEPDSGNRQSKRSLSVGFVEQFLPEHLHSVSLLEATMAVFPEEERLSLQYLAETQLQNLGFDPSQFNFKASRLSGGQQNLLLMVRARLQNPDVLVLDEPGNHMDIKSMALLENWLDTSSVPWIMVSHDRHLLNNQCRSTWVLRDQKLYCFDLPFEAAREALAKQDEDAQKQRSQEDKEIYRIEKSAKRLAIWGRTFDNEDLARKAKTMVKRAEKLKDERTFVSTGSGLQLSLDAEKLTGKQALVLEQADIYAPDSATLLAHTEFLRMNPGDRIGLLGINGSGKSTTINRIMQALTGENSQIRVNPNVRIGYYDQQLRNLESSESRFDWLRRQVEGLDDRIRQTLLHAGVAYADFDQPVNQLSGGEKARMQFALFRLQMPNFLILDEPTNHIDLEGREELIESLIDAGITLIVTIHDRQFLEDCVTDWWLIENNRIKLTHKPEDFYNGLLKTDEALPVNGSTENPGVPSKETDVLLQIEKIEKLLTENLGRKPKNQLPLRQAEWREQIDALWATIE